MSEPLPPHALPGYYAPGPRPKDLTLTALLAVGAAGLVTLSTIVDAFIVGDALSDPDAATATNLVYVGNTLLYYVLLAAAYVSTCLWLWQARENTRLISPDMDHARRSGWIWGGWVCPIVNFWFPFQIVRDIYRATARQPQASPVIGGWWTVWIVLIVAMRVSDRLATSALDGATGNGAEAAAAVVAVASVLCLALWAQVVRQITRGQHEALGIG
jgi:hypothetical protein